MEMISNAAMFSKQVQVHDQELTLYARRELYGSPAVLVGRHEIYRPPRHGPGNRPGPMHRAGLWLSHGLAIILG
jgi:hypothetical protein